MNFLLNKIFDWQRLNSLEKKQLLLRPIIQKEHKIRTVVEKIIFDVEKYGDQSIKKYTHIFDKQKLDDFKISKDIILKSSSSVKKHVKKAIAIASKNIKLFHMSQIASPIDIEIQSGIRCQQIVRPIESVGLYIPGGSAPLLSTVLMLSIPAHIANCPEIVLCSPPPIINEIIYAAHICGINSIFQIGGAQAIAALAFGTDTVPKVNKIFGPGNAYVTEAKIQVNNLLNDVVIDMPAGPSEVVIIADNQAKPNFIASDLLSQAEHGIDSQVFLITPSITLAKQVIKEIKNQLKTLSRFQIILKSLKKCRIIIAKDLFQCLEISNRYSPEHLIIQCDNARDLLKHVLNAGSVFLGHWSPESVGDYASGTNHVLPTYGYSATNSGIGVSDFQKKITVQELTPNGLLNLASTVKILSDVETMDAHKNAVQVRVDSLRNQKI